MCADPGLGDDPGAKQGHRQPSSIMPAATQIMNSCVNVSLWSAAATPYEITSPFDLVVVPSDKVRSCAVPLLVRWCPDGPQVLDIALALLASSAHTRAGVCGRRPHQECLPQTLVLCRSPARTSPWALAQVGGEYWTMSVMGVVNVSEDDEDGGAFMELGEWIRCAVRDACLLLCRGE